MIEKSKLINSLIAIGVVGPLMVVLFLLLNALRIEKEYANVHYRALVEKELDSVVNNLSAKWADALDDVALRKQGNASCHFAYAVLQYEIDAAIIAYSKTDYHPKASNLSFQPQIIKDFLLEINRQEFRDKDFFGALRSYYQLLNNVDALDADRAKAAVGIVRLATRLGIAVESGFLELLENLLLSDSADAQSTALDALIEIIGANKNNTEYQKILLDYILGVECTDGHSAHKYQKLKRLPHDLLNSSSHLSRLYQAEELSLVLADNLSSLSNSLIKVSSQNQSISFFIKKEMIFDDLKDSMGKTLAFDLNPVQISSIRPVSQDDHLSIRLPALFDSLWLEVKASSPDANRSLEKGVAGLILFGSAAIFLFATITFLFVSMRKREKLSSLKSSLLSTVSHEMKTPLTSVSALTENLLDDSIDLNREAVMEYIQDIRSENQRLQRLVENFLSYAKHEKKNSAKLYPYNLSDLLNDALLRLAVRYPIRAKDIESSVSSDILILSDSDLTQVVLSNVIDNALKYSSSAIYISAKPTENNVVVSIQDFGEGIPHSAIKTVFQQFYRVDNSLSRDTEGCGLGLYISRNMMRAMSGDIMIESQEGIGTIIHLHFLSSP